MSAGTNTTYQETSKCYALELKIPVDCNWSQRPENTLID